MTWQSSLETPSFMTTSRPLALQKLQYSFVSVSQSSLQLHSLSCATAMKDYGSISYSATIQYNKTKWNNWSFQDKQLFELSIYFTMLFANAHLFHKLPHLFHQKILPLHMKGLKIQHMILLFRFLLDMKIYKLKYAEICFFKLNPQPHIFRLLKEKRCFKLRYAFKWFWKQNLIKWFYATVLSPYLQNHSESLKLGMWKKMPVLISCTITLFNV